MKKSSSFAENRQIRVFISSTFQDMEGERSYLINRTFPKLRDLASKRGVTLTELDLRWGITDEESKSGRVVDICLREIENSIPFFIGIIGNRYGWVPEKKDIGDGVTERFPSVTHYLKDHLSVTEMEMQFGVLEREEDMHAFFYIKEPEVDPENPVMLRRLKEAVKASRYPVSTYTSLEDLGQQVETAFVSLLDQLFPDEGLTGHQKDKMTQYSFIRKLIQTYVKNQESFDYLTRFAEDPERDHLVVTGDSGMGKSALLANWAKENEHNEHFTVIPYFLSNGGNQSSSSILNYIAEEISARCGLHIANGADHDTMERLLQEFSTRKNDKLVIIIDAINQIADVKQAKLLNWLPAFPKNVKVIVSSLRTDQTMEALLNRNYHVYELSHLEEGQRRQLVEEYLRDNYSKHLEDDLISRIIKDPQCENTLVLKTLLDEIICTGRHDVLDKQIDYYLNSSSVAEFYEKVIMRFEKEFGHQFVRKVLGLLAVSRNGLTEQQIIRMTGIKPLDWSAFYCSFSTHLNNQSGRLVFTHNYITSTVQHRYLDNDPEFERGCRLTIANDLLEEQNDYAFQEVPFQLDKLKDWDRLHDYIATHRYLVYCMDFDEVEIGTYWRHIFEARPDYELEDYLKDCPNNQEEAIQFYIRLLRLCVVLFKIKPKRVFIKNLESILQKHPETATPKAYQALSGSFSGPEDGMTIKDAQRYAEKSLEICRDKNDIPGVIQSLKLMGSAYYGEHARDEKNISAKRNAFEAWKKARDLSIELHGELHPLVMDGYKDMAIMCDDPAEAERLALKGLELGIMLFGKDHPLLGRPYHYVGCVYRDMGRWEDALHYFREAYRVWLPAYGINHEIMVSSHGNQGMCLWKLGQLEEALECYNTSIRILPIIYEAPHHDRAVTQFNRARILLELGRTDECLDACRDVERTLSDKNVRSEQRSLDLEKRYLKFRKQLPKKP